MTAAVSAIGNYVAVHGVNLNAFHSGLSLADSTVFHLLVTYT
jgi:hypothetical protein